MRITFLMPNYPLKGRGYLMLPSLEFCLCSALLKREGFKDIELIDMRAENLEIDDLYNNSRLKETDILVLESDTHNHCNIVKVIQSSKEINDKLKIVLCGEIATFLPRELLKRYDNLDFIISHDREMALLELIKTISSNEFKYSEIRNLSYKVNNEIFINEHRERFEDINKLPLPDRDLFNNGLYRRWSPETIVRSSRGCPGDCDFCVKTKMYGFRTFSIKRFCDEIEDMVSKGFTRFFFSDDAFAYSDSRVKEFSDEITKRNLKIKFTSNIRIKDINEYKLAELKKSGAYRVFVGVETLNPESSNLMNKNIYLDEIKAKIELVKSYGIEVHESFIVGVPGDTKETYEFTEKKLGELKPTLVTFNILRPMPGTPIYDHPQKYGINDFDKYWFEKEEWLKLPVCSTKFLTREDIKYWNRRLNYAFIMGDNE